MINWIKRHWIWSLLLLVVGTPAGLNYSGYCWEQNRWLSDEEKIKILISNHFVSTNDYVGTVTDYTGEKPIEKKNQSTIYKTFEEFIENNQNCCGFDITKAADSGSPTFWDRIYNRYTDVMIIKYSANHTNYRGENPKESIFFINNCGKEVRW